MRGPDSVVGIATGYGLDGPGIESRWERDFLHLSRTALGPTQPPVQWVPGLTRGQRAAGAWRWPLTPFSSVVKKEQSSTSTPRMGRRSCTEPQCLYKGALYLTFTLAEEVEGLPSQGRGGGWIIKITYFLENCIRTADWQYCYIRGRSCYVSRTKQGRKRGPYGELSGTTECVTF